MLPTSQWCHSRNVGSLRLGASGSEIHDRKLFRKRSGVNRTQFRCLEHTSHTQRVESTRFRTPKNVWRILHLSWRQFVSEMNVYIVRVPHLKKLKSARLGYVFRNSFLKAKVTFSRTSMIISGETGITSGTILSFSMLTIFAVEQQNWDCNETNLLGFKLLSRLRDRRIFAKSAISIGPAVQQWFKITVINIDLRRLLLRCSGR